MFTLTVRFARGTELLLQNLRHYCSTAQARFIVAQVYFTTAFQRADIRPKAALYTFILLAILLWLAITLACHLHQPQLTPLNTPNLEKRSPFQTPERPFGGI
jgi:hypothetical protein